MKISDGSVAVRTFEEKDIAAKVMWINNPENNQYLHYQLPLDIEKTRQWFYNKDNTKRCDCVIEYTGIPVGLIGLLELDDTNRKAEFYISMGETSYKRRGIATRAIRLILEYAFSVLHFNKIYLNVDAENTAACRLYEKVGFLCEGVFVQDMYHHGKMIDRKRYAILSGREGQNDKYTEKNLLHA